MAVKYLDNIDLGKNQVLNMVFQVLGTAPGAPVAGQAYYDSTDLAVKFYNGAWKNPLARADHTGTQAASTISDLAAVVKAYRLDEFADPTSAVTMNGQKITGLADPTAPQDAATLAYVQSQLQGYTPKGSADAATTTALPACTYANGTAGAGATLTGSALGILTVDGLAITLDMIVLVKDQASAFQNGLYKCTTAGTAGVAFVLTRATNMDVAAEYGGAYIVVEATSAANSGAIFLCTTNTPTVGTTAIAFTRINSASTYTADEVSLTVSGNQFAIKSNWVGQTSITTLGTIATGTWNATTIALNKGGTGATTAAAARTNLGAVGRFAQTIGDAAATSFTITHNLNTLDVQIAVVEVATGATVFPTTAAASVNTVTASFSVAPTLNQYRVVVVG